MSKIALQLYTLRDFLKTEEDIAATLKKVADIGYRAVEIAGVGPIDTEKLKSILDSNGLECISMHIGINNLEKGLADIFSKMKILGTKSAAIGALPGEFRSKEGYEASIPKLNGWAKAFTKEGLRLGYHNHKFEFEKLFDSVALDYLFANVPDLSMELDVFWAQYGGVSPVEYIKKFKGRINEVHFKDFTIKNDQVTMAEVGEGNLPWKSIMEACEFAGTKHWIVEQDNCGERNPFESVKISLDNLKSWGVE